MTRIRRRGMFAALITGLLMLAYVGTVSAGTTSKPYNLVISPGSPTYEMMPGEVASGETVGITATFTNDTGTQQLGSANLFWPAGFNVVGTPSSTSGSASVATSCTLNGAPAGSCVQLRSLNLSPGQSATVTMSVTTPVGQAGSNHAWQAEVKQANNYSGSPGNDLFFDGTPAQLDTTLDGASALQFTTQPANTRTGEFIRGTAYTPTGPALTVQVVGAGGPVTTSTAPITMAAGTNLAGVAGTLTGTNPQAADGIDGTATFGDLKLTPPGLGYTLGASSGTLTGATSNPFDVQDQAVACSANLDCPVTDGTSAQNNARLVATASTGGGTLAESVFTNAAAQKTLCGAYRSSDPNIYDSAYTPASSTSADRSEVDTIMFSPTTKLSGSESQILKAQQICFGDAKQFVTASGALATPTTLPDGKPGFVGLLQTCTASTVGPCHDRKQDTTTPDTHGPNPFDIVLVAVVPVGWADDPMRG